MSSLQVLQDIPKPKSIEGGCLCGGVRYKVVFPDNYNWETPGTCQCTQCRKQTASLFFAHFSVEGASALQWTSAATLKVYRATPRANRGFCGACGSFLYWQPVAKEGAYWNMGVGSVDPLYLLGEGRGLERNRAGNEGEGVPEGGFGRALCSGLGRHEWCSNTIAGVTDAESIAWLGGVRGSRVEEEAPAPLVLFS